MRIAIGADHAGFRLKQEVIAYLANSEHTVLDLGTHNEDPVDYPDYAEAVGRAVLAGDADRGILICGSGVGASVAANKLPGIRAGLCHDTYSAHQGVTWYCVAGASDPPWGTSSSTLSSAQLFRERRATAAGLKT